MIKKSTSHSARIIVAAYVTTVVVFVFGASHAPRAVLAGQGPGPARKGPELGPDGKPVVPAPVGPVRRSLFLDVEPARTSPLRPIPESERARLAPFARAMTAARLVPSPARLAHFQPLIDIPKIEVVGWHGFLMDATPLPGGVRLTVRVSPKLRHDGGGVVTSAYVVETYDLKADQYVLRQVVAPLHQDFSFDLL